MEPQPGPADPQAPHGMQQFVDIYGDTMRQKHKNCQNCCVLIKNGDVSQCGFVLTCGDRFCYILTTESSVLHGATDFVITFGDEIERTFSAVSVVVQSGDKLSILFLRDGIETVQAKQQVHFSLRDKMEEAVVYTLSYIPEASYKQNGSLVPCARANSYFRGGNIGVADLQHQRVDIFYHNCCGGIDVVNGSVALNGSCDVIGMNLKHSDGWTGHYASTQ